MAYLRWSSSRIQAQKARVRVWLVPGVVLLVLVVGLMVMLSVLPFENLTGDPTREYFSDGLTEEMISHLGGTRSKSSWRNCAHIGDALQEQSTAVG
jgi:hypothetical protein